MLRLIRKLLGRAPSISLTIANMTPDRLKVEVESTSGATKIIAKLLEPVDSASQPHTSRVDMCGQLSRNTTISTVKPGDLVLLTYPFFMKPEQRAAFMKTLEEGLPGVRFCIFDGVSGISIVRKESE